MKTNLKLQLKFVDRVGLVASVATILAENGLNILSMEVDKKGDKSDIYLEAEKENSLDKNELIKKLEKTPHLLKIKTLKTLPQEEREQRFQVVLDSVSDGIISINEYGQLTTINKVALNILNYDGQEVLGKHIKEISLPDLGILDCLDGKSFTNEKKNIITKKGRFQFFATTKPIKDSKGRIVGAVGIMKDMKEIEELVHAVTQRKNVGFSDIIGKSYAIQEVISFAQKVARTDSIILIRGESGTGKELFAKAIHSESNRSGPFVPLNCAALPESLLESELFGYVGGAFTGAKKEGKPGLFEIADNGTIFLDEIAEMSLNLQVKLLRVMQEGKVRRIGGTTEIPVNVRIITATNKNLEQMVKEKLFREDLYYRINVIPLRIPPLRERMEDLPLLVKHFISEISFKLEKPAYEISTAALNKLFTHNWPGNVRELKNVVERAINLSSTDRINEDCIIFDYEIGDDKKYIKNLVNNLSDSYKLKDLLNNYERQVIEEALKKNKSIRKAAKSLGVSHTTILNKIKKLKIQSGNNIDRW